MPSSSSASTSSLPATSSPFLKYALAGAASCSFTHAILVPLDVVKTRLQINRSAFSSTTDAFKKIVQVEGAGALMTGFWPTAVGYSIQGAFKFGIFESLKKAAMHKLPSDVLQTYSLPIYITTSSLAEVIATTFLCPWEAVRIRAVASAAVLPPGTRPKLTQIYSEIVQAEGFYKGFYKGLIPILAKQVPYTVTQITAFSYLVDLAYNSVLPKYFGEAYSKKELISKDKQLAVSVVCGVMAGVASAITSHPADTILSKLNSTNNEALQKQNMFGQIKTVAGDLGWAGIWRGLFLRCVMVGTLSALMFLVYDSVKLAVGLPTTTGVGAKKNTEKI